MNAPQSASTLPDVLTVLKRQVSEDMHRDDVSARELIDLLDITWCAAERWRIEHHHPEFNGSAADPA